MTRLTVRLEPARARRSTALLALATLLSAGLVNASGPPDDAARSDLPASGKIDAALIEALGRRERVTAIAILDVRDAAGGSLKRFGSPPASAALVATGDRVLERMPAGEVELVHRYRGFNALAVETTVAGLAALAAEADVDQVGLSRQMEWSLAEALPVSGISAVRGAGKHGKGVWVAVLDSGIDTDHKDLKKPLKKQECFCRPGCCPDGTDRQSGRGSAEDDVGHGTLVSGSVVSRGKVAPRGPAMKAKLAMIKMGAAAGPNDADALAALDWVLTEMPEVQILNMSFGSIKHFGGNCDKKGATNRAYRAVIEALRDNGTLAFVASGNSAQAGKMASPACIKEAISVGASYDGDFGPQGFGPCSDSSSEANQLACFSSRSAKTDILSPGFLITVPSNDGGSATVFGTSFSSPIAAGCGVLIRKKFPDATPDEVEAALEGSPIMAVDPVNGRTYPTLDCEAAFDLLEAL